MATTVTKTIKASGGDYTSIQGWENGQDGDLVSGDTLEVGELYDKGSDWAENVTVDGSTTDATRFMRLIVPSAERHAGDETGARVNPTGSAHAFTISDDYFEMVGVRITGVGGVSNEGVRCNGDNCKFTHLYIHDLDANSENDGIYVGADDITVHVESCSFTNINRGAVIIQMHTGCTVNLRNCTALNTVLNTTLDDSADQVGGFGFDDKNGSNDNSVMLAENSVSMLPAGLGNAFNDSSDTGAGFSGSSRNNAADDTTTPGTSNQDSLTPSDEFTTVTAGSEDIHLKSASNLVDAGVDLSGSIDAEDIDNVARTGTWDIGADQFVAAGGGGGIAILRRRREGM